MVKKFFLMFWFCCATALPLAAESADPIEGLEKPLYNPFVERYILDEVKQLRSEMLNLRAEMTEKIADKELLVADKAINYATSTVNNIFYIIAAAASILVLLGWNSLREIKDKIRETVESEVADVIETYEKRLSVMEEEIRNKSQAIMDNQQEIVLTNTIQSLWMKAGIESTPQGKIEAFDQILSIRPDDVEALSYKADSVLELNEPEWAMRLCNRALAIDQENANAFYQRACACAKLGYLENALSDLERAFSLSEFYVNEAYEDHNLTNLKDLEEFQELFKRHIDVSS